MSVAFATTGRHGVGGEGRIGCDWAGPMQPSWPGPGTAARFDIGIQALSGAAERNDDIIFVCYDNEAYMNTGIQRSSATPMGTVTTTTPRSAPQIPEEKKHHGHNGSPWRALRRHRFNRLSG